MNKGYKIDAKDLKILTLLDKRARESNNQIGKKVKLSKEVVKYRIDKMIEKGIIVRFHTIINYFKLGIIKYKLYLRIANANKQKLEEIAEYFRKNNKTEWVATTTGQWDLIIGFLVNNMNEFDDGVQSALNKFSKYIKDKSVTSTLYLAHHTREFLEATGNKEDEKIVYHTTKDPQEKIDELDDKILRLLANNARVSTVDIANRLKITPRIVQYRIKSLENRKIILGYKAHLNPFLLNRIFCKAIIYLVNITHARLQEFVNYASSLPGAIWPQRVLGAWDFELDFELENYESFQDTLLKLREQFPDIIKSQEFCIMSKEYKLDLFPNAEAPLI